MQNTPKKVLLRTTSEEPPTVTTNSWNPDVAAFTRTSTTAPQNSFLHCLDHHTSRCITAGAWTTSPKSWTCGIRQRGPEPADLPDARYHHELECQRSARQSAAGTLAETRQSALPPARAPSCGTTGWSRSSKPTPVCRLIPLLRPRLKERSRPSSTELRHALVVFHGAALRAELPVLVPIFCSVVRRSDRLLFVAPPRIKSPLLPPLCGTDEGCHRLPCRFQPEGDTKKGTLERKHLVVLLWLWLCVVVSVRALS